MNCQDIEGGVQLAHELKTLSHAFLNETCSSSREPRMCTCSVVFEQNRFSKAQLLVKLRKQMNTLNIYGSQNVLK